MVQSTSPAEVSRLTLREFFEEVYVPRHLDDYESETVVSLSLAVDEFEQSLGRVPRVSDLTEKKLEAFARWCCERGDWRARL